MIQFPGTPQHQSLLEAIVRYYARDPRVHAVLLFGSLGEGTWDAFSDLDLDVIVQDGVTIGVEAELRQLAQALEGGGLIVVQGFDEGDVVLPSLMQFSIRYHPLSDTNPNILRNLRVLAGSLDVAAIEVAGEANRQRRQHPPSTAMRFNAYLRHALEVDTALRRRRLWMAVELLHEIRRIGMMLFAEAQGAVRPVHAFDAYADPALQARFAALLPILDPVSLRTALIAALELLPLLPGVMPNEEQAAMLKRIEARVRG